LHSTKGGGLKKWETVVHFWYNSQKGGEKRCRVSKPLSGRSLLQAILAAKKGGGLLRETAEYL